MNGLPGLCISICVEAWMVELSVCVLSVAVADVRFHISLAAFMKCCTTPSGFYSCMVVAVAMKNDFTLWETL